MLVVNVLLLTMQTCSICKTNQPLDQFYKKNSKNGITTHCKSCQQARMFKNRVAKKQKLLETFGGKCSRCGYDKCSRALTFHHLDPSKKGFGLATRPSASLKDLIKEAKKCILLCANCHMEKHDGLW